MYSWCGTLAFLAAIVCLDCLPMIRGRPDGLVSTMVYEVLLLIIVDFVLFVVSIVYI